ncbi:MAG TPA: hypothetical protein VNU68_02080 [Verrucomicrobiae bacterium]|nr:hypothetical protein [Verrucomicrobiae bacterium]
MDESNSTPTPNEANPAKPVSLALFIRTLAAEGRAVVSRRPLPSTPEDGEALSALAALELRARQELSGDPPPFCGATAWWAAQLFYEACRCAVCRDLSADHVRILLTMKCPSPRGPATDWSADLVLRHLPRFFRFAQQLSNGDPLVEVLRTLGAAWPLSSVGLAGLSNLALDSFIEHAVLRRLYADRLAAADEPGRLEDPRVIEVLRADLGLHHELAPRLAGRLFPQTAQGRQPAASGTASASSSALPHPE